MTFFEKLIEDAPANVLAKLEELKTLRERPEYHPEPSTYEHIKIVVNRLAETGDADLILTGLFHDLFKLDCVIIRDVVDESGAPTGETFPSSPGHEDEAEKFVTSDEETRAFIRAKGGNPDVVAFLCGQHMRVKRMKEMRWSKRAEILAGEHFEKLCVFSLADRMLMEWNDSWTRWNKRDPSLMIGDCTYEFLISKKELYKDKVKEEKMSKHKISGKDLIRLGFKQGPVISVAMQVAERNYKHTSLEDMCDILKKVLDSPAEYLEDDKLGKVAEFLVEKPKTDKNGGTIYKLETQKDFVTFGGENINPNAIEQMNVAMQLPITAAGALMPDAHAGYGLPIGGVLATKNAVIPYGVGVDIGCRMCLSIFDLPANEIQRDPTFYKDRLIENTLFGTGGQFTETYDSAVLDNPLFNQIDLLRGLKDKAAKQLGSSGSGNHFVEFGIVELPDDFNGVPAGKYLALLSHSGSRGLGATVANHYTKLAKEKTVLPKEAANLAWLSLDTQEGMEYWLAMNLAGDYASACHHAIHEKIARAIKCKPAVMVENHHNFAWKEIVNGEELIVHRKGATPAGKGVLGIIPGSMTAPGYIVEGTGNIASLASASHGAGRAMSRTVAMNSITGHAMRELLRENGVTLIGGGIDEAPQAYKDIRQVMQAQTQLVTIKGTFTPKIVKMNEEED